VVVDEDLAGIDRDHPGHEVEHGGLAGAVRADQGGARSAPHIKAEIIDRRHAAESLRDVRYSQDRSLGIHAAEPREASPTDSPREPGRSRPSRRRIWAPVTRPCGRSAMRMITAAAKNT